MEWYDDELAKREMMMQEDKGRIKVIPIRQQEVVEGSNRTGEGSTVERGGMGDITT